MIPATHVFAPKDTSTNVFFLTGPLPSTDLLQVRLWWYYGPLSAGVKVTWRCYYGDSPSQVSDPVSTDFEVISDERSDNDWYWEEPVNLAHLGKLYRRIAVAVQAAAGTPVTFESTYVQGTLATLSFTS